ncbi:MAG: hypothetical protein ACAH80_11410 [Alphaproteobacteria bacterium]
MKMLKKLALTFTLAASAFVGVGTANAQTVPANPNVAVSQELTPSRYNVSVSQEGVNDVAYTFGAERVFRNVGAGYTDRVSPLTGERIGLEFSVYNGQATVRGVYNLRDRAQLNQYLINKGNDASMDTQMALTQMQMPFGIYTYPTYPNYPPVYYPPRHVHGPAILLPPIIIGGGHHDGHRGNDRGRWDNNRGNDHRGGDHRGGDHRGGDRDHRGPRGPGR